MNKNRFLMYLILINKLLQFKAANTLWTKQLGSLDQEDIAYSVTTDSKNFVYVAGTTKGSLDGNTNAGSYDIFLSKFDFSGKKIWIKQFGTPNADQARSVTTDSNNFVYVAGYTWGSLEENTSSDSSDAFVVKFDSTGNKIWTKQFFGGSNSDWTDSDWATSIATDSNNFIYVAGYTYGSLDGKTNKGFTDAFVIKLDSAGNKIWTKQFGTSSGKNYVNSVTTDSNNFVYVAGQTYGSLEGNTNAGRSDAFLVKFDSTGNKIWTKQFGTSDDDSARSVKTDSNNFVYVAGQTIGSLDPNTNAHTDHAFLLKYDSSGNKIWTKQFFGSSKYDSVSSVTIDSNDFVYVAGYSLAGFNGYNSTDLSVSLLDKFDSAGNRLWTKQFGSSRLYLLTESITTDANNFIYIAGWTSSSDAFLVKLSGNICKESCLDCTSNNESSSVTLCNSCASDYFKKSELNFPTECFKSTPQGYFLSGSSFAKCHETCLTCSGEKASNCLSCNASSYKKADSSFPTECYNNPPSGYFLKNSEYAKCQSSCLTCKSENTSECLSCAANFSKKPEQSFPTNCYTNAPQGSESIKCFNSCLSCISQKASDCLSCQSNFYKKAETNFPTECLNLSSAPRGYYFSGLSFSKCDGSCQICSGPLPEDCLDRVTCIRDCLFCKIKDTCEVCREGFSYVKSSNTCEIINTDFCKTFDSNRKCSECLLGYKLENNACVCKGIIDQSYCCSPLDYCRPENTKYIKEIDSCGCQMCDSNKFRYNYKCVSQETPNGNCFIFDKNKNMFMEINSNECLENLKNLKIVYNQFCLNEKYITKFPLEYKNNKAFIFSMNEKGVYQYIKYSYPQEGILALECDDKINSYLYLGLKCDVAFDENFVNQIKKSKNLISQNSEKVKNETITHNFLEDVMKAYLDDCDGEVNYLKNEDLKSLCFSIESNLVDIENNSCKSYKYCSKISGNLITTINNEKCFKCMSDSYIYDSKNQNCFTFIISNVNLRNSFKNIFIIAASGVFVIAIPTLAYLYLKKYNTNDEMKLKIKEIGIIILAFIDLCLDIRFLLVSSYISTNLKYYSIICFFLQPVILFIACLFLMIFKKGLNQDCNNWCTRLILALPISCLFTIMSLLQLIGKSCDIVNKTFTAFINVNINLKLWLKLADLLLETFPELIMKFVVISLSKDYTYLNIISLILSIIGLIFSIFYLTSEWVIPESKEAGYGKGAEGENFQKGNASSVKDEPAYKIIQNTQHKTDYEKPEKDIENNGCLKLEVVEKNIVEEANGIFSNQENAPIDKSIEEMQKIDDLENGNLMKNRVEENRLEDSREEKLYLKKSGIEEEQKNGKEDNEAENIEIFAIEVNEQIVNKEDECLNNSAGEKNQQKAEEDHIRLNNIVLEA